MQRKVKLKKLPLIVAILVLIPVLTVIIFSKESMKKTNDLVTTDTISDTVPVINETRKMINPYTDSSVTISKSYYDYKGEATEQEKSITVYENTYIQNTGIDYISTNTFDIVSVLDGTVVTVKEDELFYEIEVPASIEDSEHKYCVPPYIEFENEKAYGGLSLGCCYSNDGTNVVYRFRKSNIFEEFGNIETGLIPRIQYMQTMFKEKYLRFCQ